MLHALTHINPVAAGNFGKLDCPHYKYACIFSLVSLVVYRPSLSCGFQTAGF